MIGNDRAKQDILLVTAGVLAAALFFWLFSFTHPLRTADAGLGSNVAAQISDQQVNALGYPVLDESYTTFRVISDMLKAIEQQNELDRYNSDLQIRDKYPLFHWRVNHGVNAEDWMESLSESDRTFYELSVVLSENGELIAMENSDYLFPSRLVEPAVMQQIFPGIEGFLSELTPGAELFNKFRFRFNDNQEGENGYDHDRVNYLSEYDAQRIAEYYLQISGWAFSDFEFDYAELFSVNRVEAARVLFTKMVPELNRELQLQVEVLPTGAMLSMQFEDPRVAEESSVFIDIRIGAIAVFTLIFILWIIVLLYIRIRLRLIDTRLAVLTAVLAGFAFPTLLMLNWLHNIFFSFTSFVFTEFIWQVFWLGVLAAFSSIAYFALSAVGDSITREHWAEKLRTADLVRIGHIFNRPVGLVLVRSACYSSIIAAIWVLIYYLLPDNYLSVSDGFQSDSSLLPFIHTLLLYFFVYLAITQAAFLILMGRFSSYTKHPFFIGIISAIIFMIFQPLTFGAGPYSTEMILAGYIGFSAGWIFAKDDYLTTFLTLFLIAIYIVAAPGWVMSYSPDISIFYASILLLLAFLVMGGFGIFKGKSIHELPKYVPDYITEMAIDERMKQEIQIAKKVQESFLPDKTPDIEGFDIAAICTPAYETGGDYYDFIPFDNDKLAVTIGDVSGKGIQAAFYMTFTKGVLHALCLDHNSSIDILAKINTLFRNNAGAGTFISLIFGILDPQQSTFRFSRAGHNPVLHYSAVNRELKSYRPDGIGLGITSEVLFRNNICESEISMESGDILVLFTDGVVEATNRQNDFYGDKRLHRKIKGSVNMSSDQILTRLIEDLRTFGDGMSLHDDMTILIIKKK